MRLEAVTAATYIATPQAFQAVLAAIQRPREAHLDYAIRTALGSESLLPFWRETTPLTIEQFMAAFNLSSQTKAGSSTLNAKDAAFDSQANLAEIKISCITGRLLFSKKRFEVEAGQAVKLVFTNPDATPHNLLVLQSGTPVESVGLAANEMAKSPEGAKNNFVPDDDRILHSTKMLGPNSSETLRFLAPEQPGTYPFLCTFPGHWVLMKGEMIVK